VSQDILCGVCNEPWDGYGVATGDMTWWEATLFRASKGCPCCQGVLPDGIDAEEAELAHLRSVVMNDEDPDRFERLHATEDQSTEPVDWARPEDQGILWVCAACGGRMMIGDDASEEIFRRLTTGKGTPDDYKYFMQWDRALRGVYTQDQDDAGDEQPPFTFVAGNGGEVALCRDCAEMCPECVDAILLRGVGEGKFGGGDTYDLGQSFPKPGDEYHGGSVCIDCFETLTSEDEADLEIQREQIKSDEEDDYFDDGQLADAIRGHLLDPLEPDETWDGALCDAVHYVQEEIKDNKAFKPNAEGIREDLLVHLSDVEPESDRVEFWLGLWGAPLRALHVEGEDLQWLAEEIKVDLNQATNRTLATCEIADVLTEMFRRGGA
jgi:hypothetical protein